MGIRDGDTAEAEDVNKSYFNIFENMTPIVKYLDENNLVTSYDRLGFDSGKNASKIGSFDGLRDNDYYYCKIGNYTVYDDHNDRSVDTTKWSVSTFNGSVTEDSNGYLDLNLSTSAQSENCFATCTGLNSINSNSFIVRYKGSEKYDMISSLSIILTDSINEVTLKSTSSSAEHDYYFTIEGNTCKVWEDGIYDSSVDISSLTSPYYFKYNVEGLTGPAGTSHYSYFYIDEEGYDVNYQTATFESTSLLISPDNIVSASLKKGNEDSLPSNSSINYYLSNDGGNTWEQLTESERYGDRHYFNSTGTDLKFKMILNPSSDNTSPINGRSYYIQVYEK